MEESPNSLPSVTPLSRSQSEAVDSSNFPKPPLQSKKDSRKQSERKVLENSQKFGIILPKNLTTQMVLELFVITVIKL